MDVRRTSTTYYNKDTPEVATFFSRRITNFSRYFLGSLTGFPVVPGKMGLRPLCDLIINIHRAGVPGRFGLEQVGLGVPGYLG